MRKIIFIIGLLFSQLSAVYSQPTAVAPSGSGTDLSPYQVATLANLYWISQNSSSWDKWFLQTSDIDTTGYNMQDWDSGKGWTPIGGNGTTDKFTGNYNGNGKKITGLYINRPSTDNVGLFGHVGDESSDIRITNLILENCSIIGRRGTGSLAGRVTGSQKNRIEFCSATGSVKGTGAVGGLVGSNNSYMTNPGAAEGFRPAIFECWTDVTVTALVVSGHNNDKIGGLTGCNQKGSISNCYARGSVTGATAGATVNERVGGLTGCATNRGIIINSYSTGAVTGNAATSVGVLVGNVQTGTVSNCFWDTQTSGQSSSAGGTGKTTSEMKTTATFTDASWDFNNVWDRADGVNDGYPSLRTAPVAPGTWTWLTTAGSIDWATGSNWDKGTVPSDNATVVIPTGISTNQPTLSSNANVYSISIGSGSTLTITTGNTLTFNNIASGTGAIAGAGIAKFAGISIQEVPAMTYEKLVIDNLNNVALAGNISVSGSLTLTNGLLDLNGKTLTLGINATLSESESSRIYGRTGTIVTERTLTTGQPNNIGGMGIVITPQADMGTVTITRGHTAQESNNASKLSMLRYFIVAPENNSGLNATLVFSYFLSELNEHLEDSLILYRKPAGESWQFAASVLDKNSKTITVSAIDAFSSWTASDSKNNPLPLTWLQQSAKRIEENLVEISWSTATEINCENFEIQRSMDALNFSTIFSIPASGNSTTISNYRVSDDNAPTQTLYYRLKQTDTDGKFEYSAIMPVLPLHSIEDIRIFPNPFNNDLFLVLPGESQIEIFDISGRLVYTETAQASLHQINTEGFSKGFYTIKVRFLDNIHCLKLIKN